mmetsp:Transcript_3725/g.8692  ORF Transcript_3725/g.8692 Transcript_3725/m.8692 type:complete len:104 (+) Transcript_3725:3-314(+)
MLNMFVAILIQSYQLQKRDEAVLKSEFRRHLHASEGVTSINTIIEELFKRHPFLRNEQRASRKLFTLDRPNSMSDVVASLAKAPSMRQFANTQVTSKITPDGT